MSDFRTITPAELTINPFTSLGKDWALVTASDGQTTNAMTIGWGGLGPMWGKDCAFIVIRPQRFTYSLLEQSEGFSLTFFEERYRKELSLCGRESGRALDKLAACGFTVEREEEIPYIREARLALLCRKLYTQDLDPNRFLDPAIDPRWYPEKDYHRMYIGEIHKVLVRK